MVQRKPGVPSTTPKDHQRGLIKEGGVLLTFHNYLKLCHFLPISAKTV